MDELARQWANDRGIPAKIFHADWSRFGKKAGPIRNVIVAEYGDKLIAIWDGKSRGTRDIIRRMKFLEKPMRVALIEDVRKAMNENHLTKIYGSV